MKVIFWIGIAFVLLVPIIIGVYFDDPSTSWVAALCGAFVIFMAKVESLAELSLGPVKAKMKQKLQEASATIEQLRNVAVTSSEATLTDLMAGSFMGGMTLEKQLDLHDKVINALHEIGASSEQIEKAETDWNKGVSIIYHRAIMKAVEERKHPNQINTQATDEQKAAGKEIQDLLDFKNWAVPTPHQIRTVLDKYNISSEDADKWIGDYEHFLQNKEIRNREEFVNQ